MPSYLIDWPIWRDLIPIPIFAALVSLILAALSMRKINDFWLLFGVIFAMALLGITTGHLTGQSREPAVGAVLPATLALIGGISAYWVGAKELMQQKLMSLVIIAFSFNLLVGAFWGAKLRFDFEDYLNSEHYQLDHEAIKQNVLLQRLLYEKQLNNARQHLNLPLLPTNKQDHQADSQ